LCGRFALLWTLAHAPDVKHLEKESFTPSAVPPGFCGALVGPIAIFAAVAAVCHGPTGLSLAAAKLESVTAITVTKIKYFICCSDRPDQI
jgi:hypothetical protein